MKAAETSAGLAGLVAVRPKPGALVVTDDAISSGHVRCAWQELEPAARSPFEMWAWVSGLARMPGSSARVLIAWLGERPVAALAVERDRGLAGMRRLSIAGSSWLSPDHVDVLAEPAWATAAAHAFIDHLRSMAGFELLDFSGLRPDGALAGAIAGLGGPRFHALASEDVLCPYVALSGRPQTEAGFSRNLRSQLRRGLRAVERSGGGLDVITQPDQVRGAMQALMALHNARFGQRSQVFDSTPRQRFHLDACAEFARRGMARIYRLHDGSDDLAFLYALLFQDTLYYYSMGLRTDCGGSPGLTLLGNAILSAADEGLSEFDMLRGDHEFKLRFASGVRTNVRSRVIRVSARSGSRAFRHLLRHHTRKGGNHE